MSTPSSSDAQAALAQLEAYAATQGSDLQSMVKAIDAWFASKGPAPAASIFSASAPADFKAYNNPVLQETWAKFDPKIWSNELWYGNGHYDYTVNYVDASLEAVKDGSLILTARVVPDMQDPKYQGMPYMGAIAQTYKLFSITVPFAVEVDITDSPKPYEWSSFVIQELDGWEIDIYETNTDNGKFIATSVHHKAKKINTTYGFDPTKAVDPNFKLSDKHKIHAIIDEKLVTVWVDGKLVSTFPNPGITGPMFLYFANGVGGWKSPVSTMKPFPYPGSGFMTVGPVTIGKPS